MLRHGSIMSPVERNQALGITTHQTRRQRGDLIYIYKMFESGMFTRAINSQTRGHSKKLREESAHNNIRKHSFAMRSIKAWNSLPESIVNAESMNSLKARLDECLS